MTIVNELNEILAEVVLSGSLHKRLVDFLCNSSITLIWHLHDKGKEFIGAGEGKGYKMKTESGLKRTDLLADWVRRLDKEMNWLIKNGEWSKFE